MGENLKTIYDDNGTLNALLLHKHFEKKGFRIDCCTGLIWSPDI